jgi:hypothetical protein
LQASFVWVGLLAVGILESHDAVAVDETVPREAGSAGTISNEALAEGILRLASSFWLTIKVASVALGADTSWSETSAEGVALFGDCAAERIEGVARIAGETVSGGQVVLAEGVDWHAQVRGVCVVSVGAG